MCDIKVSIIMPVYNAEKYLKETLNSIVNQSFTDYELIAIDDGSKDNSLEVLNDYKDKINNFIIKSIDNSGVSKARNIGINIARGQYICFVDSDDILHSDYLKNLYTPIELYNANLSYCGYITFYDKVLFNNNTSISYEKIKEKDSIKNFDYVTLKGYSTQVWNKMYKISYLKEYEIYFNESSSFGEDMFFNWKYFLVTNNIYYVNDTLYGYRQNVLGATMKYHNSLYDCYRNEYTNLLDFAKNKNIDLTELYKSINNNLLKRFYSIFMMNTRRKDGIKNSYKYISYILNEKQVQDALKLYDVTDQSKFNKTDKKIINLMKNNKKIRLLLLSYYLDYKFRLSRCIKSYIRKFILR